MSPTEIFIISCTGNILCGLRPLACRVSAKEKHRELNRYSTYTSTKKLMKAKIDSSTNY